MARFDIEYYNGPYRVEWFPLDAGESYEQGEPLVLDTGGDIRECADDPDGSLLYGISSTSGDTSLAATDIGGYRATYGQVAAGGAVHQMAENDPVGVILPLPGTRWVTSNFATDGAGTAATPLATHVGDPAGLTLATGVWSLDTGTTNLVARITDVLDAQGIPIEQSGGTGARVVFEIIQHQNSSGVTTTDVAAAAT